MTMITVLECMTENPYTLRPDNTVDDARKSMAERKIRHIPIVNDALALVGIVSQRDILAAEDSSLVNTEENRLASDKLVALSSIMTTSVQTAEENSDLRATATRLLRNKLGCLPVVKGGRLVGIITDSDFVAIAINLMEQLEMAEPNEYEDDDLDRRLDEVMGLDYDDL
jgi:CBS domain-containing membrane protein